LNIGFIIGRIGGIDGVALETEKWIQVLKKQGHTIFILTGVLDSYDFDNVTILPELDFHHPLTFREQEHAFFRQHVNEDRLISRLEKQAHHIETDILRWIIKQKIDVIVSENATALPCHLTMGWAITHVLEKTHIPCVAHDHDFYWERGDRYKSNYSSIRKLIKDCFPIKSPNVQHVVINLHSQKQLKKRFDIYADVVPNVMDFSTPYAKKDNFNKNLLKQLKIDGKKEIALFQVTRIGERKRIDTAIELISRLDDPKIKLVITGTDVDDKNTIYYAELFDLVDDLKIHDQVIFAGNRFSGHRVKHKRRRQQYSIEDAYVYARACTYFSNYEGFGNAFIEAVAAKKPIFVNNYKPVYWTDIGSKGFETVMIENNRLTDKAVSQIKEIINSPKQCREIAEHNFKIGKANFSYEVLDDLLSKIFKKVTSTD